jgi:regulation of enolase protein 1 (concanavalin A-like superfamily)
MVLQNYKIDGDYICISKEELEKWRKHYHELSVENYNKGDHWRMVFYGGKRDVIIDMLKMFEQLEG